MKKFGPGGDLLQKIRNIYAWTFKGCPMEVPDRSVGASSRATPT